MKKSVLGKKFSQAGIAAAVAGAFMAAPMQAQAIALDWTNLGAAGAPTAPTPITADKVNTIASPQLYTATVNLGAGGAADTLDANDTFFENLNLITNSSSLGGGDTSFELGGDYTIFAAVDGSITSTNGTPIVLNPDNTVSSDETSAFSINFNAGTTLELFNTGTNEKIADLVFISGGGSDIQLVAGSFIGDITLNAMLGTGCINCDPYIQHVGGGTIAGSEILTITTGSARFLDFAGSNFATNTLNVNFQDNGESTTFVGEIPEPASLALMGIGLLGLGAFRRGKKLI